MVAGALIGASMAGSIAPLGLSGTCRRNAGSSGFVSHAVGIHCSFLARSFVNLQQRRVGKLQTSVSRLPYVAGLVQRNSGFRVSAMAEESSSESSVSTEDRASSPEDEDDQANISEILRVVELLKKKRDMTFNEVRLTIMIEDPREVERRRQLGIEDERGCSKEDMGIALQEVYEGRIPEDRLVLRELTKEMLNWPNLEDEISEVNPLASPYAKMTPTGVDPKVAAQRAKIDWDAAADIEPGETPKDLSDMVPPVVGFSFLYLVSFIPVIIVVAVVLILFFNSLQ